MTRYIPHLLGLASLVTLTSSIMLIYRLLGLAREHALYAALLTVVALGYGFGQYSIRQTRRK